MRKRGDIVWRTAAEAALFASEDGDDEQAEGDERAEGEERPAPKSPLEGDERADIAIGIKHLGVGEAQRNLRKLRRLRLDELRRLKKEQAALLDVGGKKEDAPELFPEVLVPGDVRTPEGEEQLGGICREIVGSVLGGHRGLDLEENASDDVVLDELERLGLLEIFMPSAMEVQSPEPQFRAADDGPSGGDDAA